MSEPIIGIDFGTTKCVAAVYVDGKATVLEDEDGHRFMPSVVALMPDHAFRIGWDAAKIPPLERWKTQCVTIEGIKRDLGKKGEATWGAYRTYPQEIAALLLGRLRLLVHERLGAPINKAVLAVPACFDLNEKQALRDAAELAGLEMVRTIHEPTAAALAYGISKAAPERIAVFDLGGGTLDITILEIGDGVYEVKASAGEALLGGLDFTQAIVDFLKSEFLKAEGIDLLQHPEAMARLIEASEQAKCELSSQLEVPISLPYLIHDSQPRHLSHSLSRKHFEELTRPLSDRIAELSRKVLKDADLTPARIDKVVIVGGATRLTCIGEIIQNVFGKPPLRTIDPTEGVALGAAILGGVLGGNVKDALLLDVVSSTLGVGMADDQCKSLIARNTTVPTRRSDIFTTTKDNQTVVDVVIYQGENPILSQNKRIGTIHLDGIPPAPKGIAQIEVSFDIDATHSLKVSAMDLGTKASVHSRMDRTDSCLNPAQHNILAKKVSEALGKTASELGLKEELRRAAAIIPEASRFAKQLSNILQSAGSHLEPDCLNLLDQGRQLIQDCLDRQLPPESIQEMMSRIRPAAIDASLNWFLRTLDVFAGHPAYGDWLMRAGSRKLISQAECPMNWLLEKTAPEISDLRSAWEHVRNLDRQGQYRLQSSIAAASSRKFAVAVAVQCLDMPASWLSEWISSEILSRDLSAKFGIVLARHARSPRDRTRAITRLVELAEASDIATVCSLIEAESVPATANDLAWLLADKHRNVLWKFCLAAAGELQIDRHPRIRSAAARSAIHAIGGSCDPQALDLLETIGLAGNESLAFQSIATIPKEDSACRLLRLLLRNPSREAYWCCLETAGRFSGNARVAALEHLSGQEQLILDTIGLAQNLSANADRLRGAILATHAYRIHIPRPAFAQLLRVLTDEETLLLLLDTVQHNGDALFVFETLSAITYFTGPIEDKMSQMVQSLPGFDEPTKTKLSRIMRRSIVRAHKPGYFARRFIRNVARQYPAVSPLAERLLQKLPAISTSG